MPLEPLNRLLRSLPRPNVLEYMTLNTEKIVHHLTTRLEGGSREIEDPLYLPNLKTVTALARSPTINLHALLRYAEFRQQRFSGLENEGNRATHIVADRLPLQISFRSTPWSSPFANQPAWDTPTEVRVLEKLKDLGVTLYVSETGML
jgi:hypothetical protein